MNINCDFSQELTVWPHWVGHLPSTFHLKRACHVACQTVCLFCMLLVIWGYNLETQYLVSAVCNELLPPSNLDKNMSYEKAPRSTNVKTYHKAPLPFIVPQGLLLWVWLVTWMEKCTHRLIPFCFIHLSNPTPEKGWRKFTGRELTTLPLALLCSRIFFSAKVRIVNISLCRPYGLCHNYSTLPFVAQNQLSTVCKWMFQ